MRQTGIIALAAILLAAAGTAAVSQPEQDASEMAELSERVKELNGTLEEIVGYLQQQLQAQRTDQLLQRIDLQRRALEPPEEELRTRQAAFEELDRNLSRAEVRRDLLRRPPDDNLGGNAADETQLRMAQEQADRQIEAMLTRRDELEQRIGELEGRVQGMRTELRKWEETLDREMGLR